VQVLSQIIEICVFRITDSAPQYLILQRSSIEKLYPNLWQIVTGTVNPAEKAMQTAFREIEEEIGLLPKKFWAVPYVDSYFDMSKDAVQLAAVFAAEISAEAKVHLSSEHQNYAWLEYQAAKELLVWPGQKIVIDIVHDFIVGKKEAGRLLEIVNH
jgi:dihydroneopterin triphosphate diphosphatase